MKLKNNRNPISVAEAVFRVVERARRTGTETVPLAESYGRILVEPLAATHDVPHFDRSPTMDLQFGQRIRLVHPVTVGSNSK